MHSPRKAIILTLCILTALTLSACSRESQPDLEYSGIKEVDIDELYSKSAEKEPKETKAETNIIPDTTDFEITEEEPVAITVEEEPQAEETPDPTETEPPPMAADHTHNYSGDELLRKRFSEEEINYLHNCAFLGDSTCLGYCRYNLIEEPRVLGNGGVAARNIHTHSFTQWGQEVDFLTGLRNTGCTQLYFQMGMNDVRIISAEEYKENYKVMLKEVKEFIPDANIHILSITPITEDSDFYPNERIDLLNEKLKEIAAEEGYTFIDTASAVRNEKGFLKDELCSGDGIHMVTEAYYLMLGVIFESAGF